MDGAAGGGNGRRAGRPLLPAATGPCVRADRRHGTGHRAGGVHRPGRLPRALDHGLAVPAAAGVEALAINIPLFLLLFAVSYVVLATLSTSNFGDHLSHTDGLYFAVTVFSTVGFGDITAKTETARLVVIGQMIADLIILGLAIKVIVGAVKLGRQRQNTPGQHPDPARPTSRADETR